MTTKKQTIYDRICLHLGEFSVQQLEKECGLGNGAIKKWGEHAPLATKLLLVAEKLGLSVDYLLGRNGIEPLQMDSVYCADEENKIQSPHLVAHLDILGTKAMVASKETNSKLLERMIEISKSWETYIASFNSLKLFAGNLAIKIFSDNIVLYLPFKKENYRQLLVVICLCAAFFQRQLLLYDKFPLTVRGGIALENFYADSKFVYGQALIESYEIEENLAVVPRIVVSQTIIDTLFNKNEINDLIGYNNILLDDFDGFYYVNFLYDQNKEQILSIQKFISESVAKIHKKHGEQVAEFVRTGKNSIKDYSKILQKYGWLLKYTCRFYEWKINTELNMHITKNYNSENNGAVYNESTINNNGNNTTTINGAPNSQYTINNYTINNQVLEENSELITAYKSLSDDEKALVLSYIKSLKK